MAKNGNKGKKPERDSKGHFKPGVSGNPSGNKEKYTKAFADELAKELPEMFKNGESLAEVCAALRMAKNTFYKCCEISPALKEAYEMGTLLSEAWWQKLGRAGSAGQVKIQPITWKFNMQNRFGWAEKLDQTQNVSAQVSNTFTKEDYDKAEKDLQEEFGDLD